MSSFGIVGCSRARERGTSQKEQLQAARGLMVGAEDVGPGAASESRPKRGRNAADLARASLLPLQPQVGFPVQLKLQMVRKGRKARRVPRTAPGAIADPLRDPAGLDYNGKPLPGVLAEFAFLRGEHLACLR